MKYTLKTSFYPRSLSLQCEEKEVGKLSCGWLLQKKASFQLGEEDYLIEPKNWGRRTFSILHKRKEIGRIKFNRWGRLSIQLQLKELQGREFVFRNRGMFSFQYRLEEGGKNVLSIMPNYGKKVGVLDYSIHPKKSFLEGDASSHFLLLGVCAYGINYFRQSLGLAWELA